MEQVGLVKTVSNGRAEVEIKRISGCGGGCKSCGGCDTPTHTLILKNDLGAKAGDFVVVQGESKKLLKYTMIVYMIPFFMLVIGIFSSVHILKNMEISNYEPLSFLIGIVFLALGYFIVRIYDNSIGKKEDDTVTMIKIM